MTIYHAVAAAILIPTALAAWRVWRDAYREAEQGGAVHTDRATRPTGDAR